MADVNGLLAQATIIRCIAIQFCLNIHGSLKIYSDDFGYLLHEVYICYFEWNVLKANGLVAMTFGVCMCVCVCVFITSEQVKEDQREIQRPGWRGQRAHDAAARGEKD